MRRPSLVVIAGALTVAAAGAVRVEAGAPSPLPSQSAPLDVGSRTHGVGSTAPVAQPAPPPAVDVRPEEVPPGSGPDTPGKTGLGYGNSGPAGGAQKGPGTQPKTGAQVGLGTPAPTPGPR